MTDNCPCKGCTDRAAECHSTCEKYAVWAAETAKQREKRSQMTYVEWQLISATHEKWDKWKRNHR